MYRILEQIGIVHILVMIWLASLLTVPSACRGDGRVDPGQTAGAPTAARQKPSQSARNNAEPEHKNTCSAERLRSLDLGIDSVKRSPVGRSVEKPPMGVQTVAEVACRPEQSDERCIARALASIENSPPRGERSSRIDYEKSLYLATLEIDGKSEKRTYDSDTEMLEQMQSLQQAGHTVFPIEGREISDTSGPRRALVTESIPPPPGDIIERFSIELEVTFEEESIMLFDRVQNLVQEAGLSLVSWQLMPTDDSRGRAHITIGCWRESRR